MVGKYPRRNVDTNFQNIKSWIMKDIMVAKQIQQTLKLRSCDTYVEIGMQP